MATQGRNILPTSMIDLTVQNQQVTSLPYEIPVENNLQSLNISGSLIKSLPNNLNNLKFLDASNINMCENQLTIDSNKCPKLQKLIISNNNISDLPTWLLSLSSLRDLTLEGNKLGSVQNDFSSLPLECLDLFLNLYFMVPKLPDTLISLNIGFNHLRLVEPLSLPNLTELRLSGNEIAEISPECRFPNLIFLDLSLNQLVSLPPISAIAPKLTTLIAYNNFLKESPVDLPSTLIKLDLRQNLISEWETDLSTLESLSELDISHNLLKVLPSLPPTLKRFNGNNNHFTNTSPLPLQHLTTLYLNNNDLTSFPDLSGSKVANLMLRNNQIASLDSTLISAHNISIDLTNNKISSLPDDVDHLESLSNVQSLILSANLLTSIPPLSNLKLTVLNLSENAISSLSELPPTLLTIILSGCAFETVPESILSLHSLQTLDMSNNKLTSFPPLPFVTADANILKNIIIC